MSFKPALVDAASDVLALARTRGLSIVTAESCTSGLLASVLSEAPGAAELLHGGVGTQTKHKKTTPPGRAGEVFEQGRGGDTEGGPPTGGGGARSVPGG